MEEYLDIIQELYRRTSHRELNWQPTGVCNQYVLPLGNGKVQLDYYDGEDCHQPDDFDLIYRICFLNKRDEVIEELRIYDKTDSHYGLFDNLWNEISDSYFLRKETINSMKAALGLSGS